MSKEEEGASNLDFERNQLEVTICEEFEEADSEALQVGIKEEVNG